jgi:hypothetical protein
MFVSGNACNSLSVFVHMPARLATEKRAEQRGVTNREPACRHLILSAAYFRREEVMEAVRIYKFLMVFLIIGAAAVWIPDAAGQRHHEWQKLPKMVFQECVTAERSVEHNPLSRISNDFLVITSYEEYGHGAPRVNRKPDASGNAKALNVYLVVGVYVVENQGLLLVFHDISLVVSERVTPSGRSAKPVLRRWILVDQDGDGVLDKAVFSEGADETTGSQQGINIPSAKVPSLQKYFEQAVRDLNKKASKGPANACIPA